MTFSFNLNLPRDTLGKEERFNLGLIGFFGFTFGAT
jgi:hypothetical protein